MVIYLFREQRLTAVWLWSMSASLANSCWLGTGEPPASACVVRAAVTGAD